MYLKIIIYNILVTLNVFVEVRGCKVYCLPCPSDWDYPNYYCCMEEAETQLNTRDCEYAPVSSTTTPSPVASPTTPCSTLVPNRCPESGTSSLKERKLLCEAFMKIHPSPMPCSSDTDCRAPFNICCEDLCYSRKICKTYLDEF